VVDERAWTHTVSDALASVTATLRDVGIEAAAEEAEILVAAVLGSGRAELGLRGDERLGSRAARRLAGLVVRRSRREPIQHVLGVWPFLELDLVTDARALVPRPETEDLALRARERAAEVGATLAIDVGTGAGCLALALAAALPRPRVVAIDVCADALALAALNAERIGLVDRVDFLRGDLLGALAPERRADLVVANLPYVCEDEIDALEPEVRDHDPRVALVAPERGLGLIRRLVSEAPARLRDGGWLLLEMAPWQTDEIAEELARAAWRDVGIVDDHQGRARIVEARRGGADG
jgi:release factor glutamine methyltransferase